MKEGGWVFLSHSHQDITKVRRLRNHLEKLGFEPLMFYLKCLSDEDEIEDLIKREIRERDWFIYADSPNARRSQWVKTEREYIEELTGKNVFTVDLSADIETQLKQIEHIARQMKVFLSYVHRDKPLMQRIRKKLLEKDMMVLSDEENIPVGENWHDAILLSVEQASKNGFVLALLTETAVRSPFMQSEIREALRLHGKVVPIYVGKATAGESLLPLIGDLQGVHVSEEPTEEELDRVVDAIVSRVEYYESDFRNTYGYRSAKTIRLPPIARIDDLTFFDCENLEVVYIPDTVIYITLNAFEQHPNILVKCSSGSYAEHYCQKNGVAYELTNA